MVVIKKMALLMLVVLVVLPVATALAQEPQVFVITEAQMNNSYVVTNPIGRRVTDVRVDIQDGQMVVTGIYRRPGRAAVELSAVFTASIEAGRVVWTLQSATVNGEAAPQDVIDALQLGLRHALMHSIRQHFLNCIYDDYDATSVVLANDSITVTYVAI